ncbi:MAG: hypothetical protein JWP60_1039, partial [Ramlibacter sp.]|nr:hypothetical protein [Ramlibacter sp.]
MTDLSAPFDLPALREGYRQKKASLLEAAGTGSTARGTQALLRQFSKLADELL